MRGLFSQRAPSLQTLKKYKNKYRKFIILKFASEFISMILKSNARLFFFSYLMTYTQELLMQVLFFFFFVRSLGNLKKTSGTLLRALLSARDSQLIELTLGKSRSCAKSDWHLFLKFYNKTYSEDYFSGNCFCSKR